MARLRVALVGCGGRGRGHLALLKEFEDVELAAVCDPVAIGTIPAATAAAEPEDEPPGVCSRLCGLRVLPVC